MARKYQDEKWASVNVGNNAVIVSMTATPSIKGKTTFLLEQDDWDNEVLSQRFMSRKPVNLVTAKIEVKKTDDVAKELKMKQLAKKFTDEAESVMGKIKLNRNPVVGVVVNTVALANIIYDRLSQGKNADVVKIIGRIRPFERDALLEKFLPRMKAGRRDDANPAPLYVVATQTVEVGANLDFDALITEDASLDALRQRFGRLNRMGTHSEAYGVIIHSPFRKEPGEFIYGGSWNETWKWLEKTQKEKRLDFGVHAMEELLHGTDILKLLTPKLPAPILMPSHMDMLIQTSPLPAVEPEISWLLHGSKTSPADVQVIWRGDLPAILGEDDTDIVMDCVSLMPPTTYEAVAVPVWALKSMLKKISHDFSDVEGGILQGPPNGDKKNKDVRSVFLWLGQDNSRIIGTDEISPGETIILPSAYGGYDQYGWNPSSYSPVSDVADVSAMRTMGKRVMRIHPAFMASWFDAIGEESVSQCRQVLSEALAEFDGGEELPDLVDKLLDRMVELSGMNQPTAYSLMEWRHMRGKRVERVYPSTGDRGFILEERRRTPKELTDDDDTSSYTELVTLDMHSKGVEKQSRHYAEKIGLCRELCDSVAAAGLLHDLGKADPRFQSWLRGGIIGTDSSDLLLAKSLGSGVMDFRSIQRSRQMSGYPKGGRHECYSAAITMENPELVSVLKDSAELIIYLIGSHHGRGRAMMPAIEDGGMDATFEFMGKRVEFHGTHGLDRIDSGWPDMFWKLVRKYGYWGLSYLEMMVRLGDHRESAMEVRNGRIQ
jgi:CRISPR-associated endonuclease/helicase Cas3